MRFDINPDIKEAHTLPASFYQNKAVYHKILENAFIPSWQWVGDNEMLQTYNCYPISLLKGSINEPLLLTLDKDNTIRCMSNVCTHRGKILIEEPKKSRLISCGYHGRCFNLNGQFRSMPEFKEAKNFPSEADHLPQLSVKKLGNLLFTSLAPTVDFETVFEPILKRMNWFPFDKLRYSHAGHRDYETNAHWALYVDNYLEGFHVPFVHPALGARLDYANYTTELFDYCNLQVGAASDDASAFELPSHSPDYGQRIHAYYWWIFPNIMLNIYTWGISINVVEPMGLEKTRISFRTYLLEGKTEADFSGDVVHQTELEDEEVVESVQQGLKSRLYNKGRFSPKREQCVHHFHQLLSKTLG